MCFPVMNHSVQQGCDRDETGDQGKKPGPGGRAEG